MLCPTHAYLFSAENEKRMKIRFKEMCEKRKKNKQTNFSHTQTHTIHSFCGSIAFVALIEWETFAFETITT